VDGQVKTQVIERRLHVSDGEAKRAYGREDQAEADHVLVYHGARDGRGGIRTGKYYQQRRQTLGDRELGHDSFGRLDLGW